MAEILDIIFVFIIIIVNVKVDISRNLESELHHQENAWLVSIANTNNTIFAFGFIFWKKKFNHTESQNSVRLFRKTICNRVNTELCFS